MALLVSRIASCHMLVCLAPSSPQHGCPPSSAPARLLLRGGCMAAQQGAAANAHLGGIQLQVLFGAVEQDLDGWDGAAEEVVPAGQHVWGGCSFVGGRLANSAGMCSMQVAGGSGRHRGRPKLAAEHEPCACQNQTCLPTNAHPAERRAAGTMSCPHMHMPSEKMSAWLL